MSDPLNAAQIDDVLASIRRLVSDELRQPGAGPAAAGELILTPSLRAVDPSGPAPSALSLTPETRIWDEDTAPEANFIAVEDDVDEGRPETMVSAFPTQTPAGAEVLPFAAPAGSAAEPLSAEAPFAEAEIQTALPDLTPDEHEALRRMVREIIREELKSALGVKISRSIRRFVREEIARQRGL